MTIRCGRVRRLLLADEHPGVPESELDAARAHIRTCAGCEQFSADTRTARRRLRVLAPRPEAPTALRERLFDAIARERVALVAPASEGENAREGKDEKVLAPASRAWRG